MGDSRAVLVRAGGKILPLSNDHKPMRKDEKQRIENAGGSVVGGRVMGRLAVSRAFGQKKMKTTGVVSVEPEVISAQLFDNDQFVILACDGLWDVMDARSAVNMIHSSLQAGSDLQVVRCVCVCVWCVHVLAQVCSRMAAVLSKKLNLDHFWTHGAKQGAAKALTDQALKCGSEDNITAMIVALTAGFCPLGRGARMHRVSAPRLHPVSAHASQRNACLRAGRSSASAPKISMAHSSSSGAGRSRRDPGGIGARTAQQHTAELQAKLHVYFF